MMTAYGEPFSVQQQGDEVVLTLRKAECQTLWIPIENSAKESYMEVEGSSLYTVPMTVRLATDKIETYMPLHLDKGAKTIKFSECKSDIVAWKNLKMGKNPNPKIEDFRQAIHFTPELGGINDPN